MLNSIINQVINTLTAVIQSEWASFYKAYQQHPILIPLIVLTSSLSVLYIFHFRAIVLWYWSRQMMKNGGVFYMGRYRVTAIWGREWAKDLTSEEFYFLPVKPLHYPMPQIRPKRKLFKWVGVKK